MWRSIKRAGCRITWHPRQSSRDQDNDLQTPETPRQFHTTWAANPTLTIWQRLAISRPPILKGPNHACQWKPNDQEAAVCPSISSRQWLLASQYSTPYVGEPRVHKRSAWYILRRKFLSSTAPSISLFTFSSRRLTNSLSFAPTSLVSRATFSSTYPQAGHFKQHRIESIV